MKNPLKTALKSAFDVTSETAKRRKLTTNERRIRGRLLLAYQSNFTDWAMRWALEEFNGIRSALTA